MNNRFEARENLEIRCRCHRWWIWDRRYNRWVGEGHPSELVAIEALPAALGQL